MQETSKFSLKPYTGRGHDPEYHRNLWFSDKKLRRGIFGEKITFQYKLSSGYLLGTEYDYFDGVHNSYFYLDNDLRFLDEIYWHDTFGFMQDLKITNKNEICFGFYDSKDIWHLSIEASGYRNYWLTHTIHRPVLKWLSKRYLRLESK